MTKMTKRKRIVTLIMALAVSIGLCISVLAAPIWTNVRIAHNNIRINIDGEQITPRDAAGNTVEPFIMDGTTYLPVRAIADALGMEVRWDGDTNTVFLTTPTSTHRSPLEAFETRGTSGTSIVYEENVSFRMLGYDYTGFTFGNSAGHRTISSLYNLGGRYTTVRGTVGRIDDTGTRGGTFSIYLDDVLFTGLELSPTMATQEIVIDVRGVRVMRIEVDFSTGSVFSSNMTTFGFGNMTIE